MTTLLVQVYGWNGTHKFVIIAGCGVSDYLAEFQTVEKFFPDGDGRYSVETCQAFLESGKVIF